MPLARLESDFPKQAEQARRDWGSTATQKGSKANFVVNFVLNVVERCFAMSNDSTKFRTKFTTKFFINTENVSVFSAHICHKQSTLRPPRRKARPTKYKATAAARQN